MIERQAPRRWLDAAIALLLFVSATAVLVVTNDMGFVRDEAFYFRHAEGYQEWFVDVEAGGEKRAKALSRDRTLATWRQNSEHPPLNKILFGYSWRLLGRKLRPVADIRQTPKKEGARAQATAEVVGLAPSHGFEIGAQVQVLSPQILGQSSATTGRELVRGQVIARDRRSATLRLAAGAAPEKLRATCQSAGPGGDGVMRRTGCEAVELRASYFLSESAAMRFPGAVFAALLVMAIFLAARGFFSGWRSGPWVLERPFALLAAVGYLLLPRAFYHAHLCTFDTTIAALLFVTTMAYHRSLRATSWVWWTALLWGISLLAKHNALFFPIPLIGHWLWDGLAEGRVRASWPGWLTALAAAMSALAVALWLHPVLGLGVGLLILAGSQAQLRLPAVPRAYFAMLPVGIALLVAGWPLLWHDTADNFLKWMEFHLNHEHYMQEYFGRVLAFPPFPVAMPWVLTALTWTLPLLAALLVGVLYVGKDAGVRWWTRWRRRAEAVHALTGSAITDPKTADRRSLERLIVLGAIWPIALIAMPSTPVFGGTKHWFLAYPFMLLIAGYGLQQLWRGLCKRWLTADAAGTRALATVAAWLLVGLIALPSARATRAVHPHGTAYYNELIGGVPGAADGRMQRQFWGGSTRDGLAAVNRRAPKGARIWFHKCAWTAYVMYQREGWFRRDLSYATKPVGTAMGLYHHQKDHDDYELECMADYGVKAPVMQMSIEGVPVLSVYERPR